MTPSKYRKKPVEVEAMRWDGTLGSIKAICDWANGDRSDEPWVDYLTNAEYTNPFNVLVHTLEGEMRVLPGDWIIRGVAGEFYPIKPKIFEATYEAAEGAVQ